MRLLSILANSSSSLLNPDRNPLLRFLLKKTFYAQFCAGETPAEVKKTAAQLESMGYKGVILAYGKEIVLEKGEKLEILKSDASTVRSMADGTAKEEVQSWKEGTLKTIDMTKSGDFMALKFSGAGRDIMRRLAANLPPTEVMESAMIEICERAKQRNIGLLFDAEQTAVQNGIDAWTMDFQKRYNRDSAIVFGTYQAYLKATPRVLMRHLASAHRDGFVLGIKLVRGAYMASDPRHCIWDTKAQTDAAYDGIVEALTTKSWNETLKDPAGQMSMPRVNLVLASHNMETIKKAMAICQKQTLNGQEKIDMSYGQLMGMADEVGCEIVMATKRAEKRGNDRDPSGPSAFKYCVWGSVGECMQFLLRRAEENQDAMIRACGTRTALAAELRRRLLG